MKGSLTEYTEKNKQDLISMKARAIKLKHDLKRLNLKMKTKDFDLDKDLPKWLKLDGELSCLILRIESEENFAAPLANKKRNLNTYTKEQRRSTKRCG